jgi:hypothetical protein
MQAILAQFPPGTETMAWVNPTNPAETVLIRDKRTAIYSIWFPCLFGIAASSLARNLSSPRPRS